MIVIDTSALLAILQGEPEAASCRDVIAQQDEILIAAPTLTEALIVADRRNLGGEMGRLISDLELKVMPFTESLAYLANRAYSQWGRGVHPAKLNLGDTFAFALADELDCPLLYVGNDFARTGIRSAFT